MKTRIHIVSNTKLQSPNKLLKTQVNSLILQLTGEQSQLQISQSRTTQLNHSKSRTTIHRYVESPTTSYTTKT